MRSDQEPAPNLVLLHSRSQSHPKSRSPSHSRSQSLLRTLALNLTGALDRAPSLLRTLALNLTSALDRAPPLLEYLSHSNDMNNVQLNDDVLGLIVFKSDLHDPSSSLASWKDDLSACSWNRVQCNPATGRVTEINLVGLGLSGRIEKGLEKLQHLMVLSLSHNNFNGSITPSLTLSSTIQNLNLSHNGFSGQMPTSFFNMSSIRSLDLSHNSFSGHIPQSFFDSYNFLHYFSLSNNLFEGQSPSRISRCLGNWIFSAMPYQGLREKVATAPSAPPATIPSLSFDPNAGIEEERAEVESLRQKFNNNLFSIKQSSDLLMRLQGLGKKKTDESEHFVWKDDIKVPWRRIVASKHKDSPLEYNEYVVYDPK
ncbi:putative inactive leucine-rich repeat receptor-like protein kinase [Arachis hypogaea]|nr:putative inactive leucine-rich repeat receptor-like protein kinase [Arachis hypogaea]